MARMRFMPLSDALWAVASMGRWLQMVGPPLATYRAFIALRGPENRITGPDWRRPSWPALAPTVADDYEVADCDQTNDRFYARYIPVGLPLLWDRTRRFRTGQRKLAAAS